MANDINIEYSTIDSVSRVLDDKAEETKSDLQTLKTKIDTLLDDGLVLRQSSPALQQSYQELHNSLTDAVHSISDFSEQFTTIKSQMEKMDQDITHKVKNPDS